MTKADLKEGAILRHFKGGRYKVVGVAKHSETLADFVVYEALYDNKNSKLWVRPIEMFFDLKEFEGKMVPRFVLEK
jgi:hypothetical protein